jgi:Ca-activated chloride channel homolog
LTLFMKLYFHLAFQKNMYYFKKNIFFVLLYFLYGGSATAQSAHQYLRKGNNYFSNQDYTAAEESYRKTLEQDPNSLKGTYNLGNAIYEQKRYDEALKHYENALKVANNNFDKAQTHYNMGNVYLQQHEYDKSVTAFKNALRLRPNDMNAKYNLALAQKRYQQVQRNKQKPNTKDQPNNKKTPNTPNGNGSTPDPKNAPKDPKSQPQQGDQTNENTAQKVESLSKQQARELLSIMDNEERKVQEKVNKAKGSTTKNGKDW